MTRRSTVMIVDDGPDYRQSLARLLNRLGYEVKEYASGTQFLAEYDPDLPGCVLLDLKMPELDGLSVLARLAARTHHAPVIMVTGHADVPVAVSAMKCGAFDFLEKPCVTEVLQSVINRAFEVDGKRWLDYEQSNSVREMLARLSADERRILELTVQGMPNKNIASELKIALRTVHARRGRALAKLRLKTRAELSRFIVQATLAGAGSDALAK